MSFFLFFIAEYNKKYVILTPILEVMRFWEADGRVRYRPQLNDSLRRAEKGNQKWEPDEAGNSGSKRRMPYGDLTVRPFEVGKRIIT